MDQTSGDMNALIKSVQDMQGEVESHIFTPNDDSFVTILTLPANRQYLNLATILDAYRPRPRFLKENAVIGDTDSLIAYALRFRTSDSALFVNPNPDKPSLTLVVDYHSPSVFPPAPELLTLPDGADSAAMDFAESLACTPPNPAHGHHTATYRFPLSDDMQAWIRAAKGGLMDGEAFAWLLNERQNDISNPPVDWMMVDEGERDRICAILNLRDDHQPRDAAGQPIPWERLDIQRHDEEEVLPTGYRTRVDKLRAKRFGTQHQLLTLSTRMSVATTTSTKQSIRLQDGAHMLEIREDNQATMEGRPIKVPELFLIDIPIFDGEPSCLMAVRLYYRRAAGGIKWQVELVDHRRMLRNAIMAAALNVADATDLPLINGQHRPA